MSNEYTLKISDDYALLSSIEKELIYKNADAVCQYISRYVEWKGCLDLEVRILPDSQNWTNDNGLLPTLRSISWNGLGWNSNTLSEALTGVDPIPSDTDIGCYMFLGEDGLPRNLGQPLWFDLNPSSNPNVSVPEGYHDFYGILVQNIFHGLGIESATIEFQKYVIQKNDFYYFNGPITTKLYGGPLPLNGSKIDKYGNDQNPDTNFNSGLLYQWGNYDQNRLEIGKIDLAVLEDLGYQIKTYDGLPLFEEIDRLKQPTIAISSNYSALTVDETATISFTLSEASTNFALADVTASGGTLSNFSGSGTSYTALFTPTPNSTTKGVVSVSSTQFTDAAGNNNTASNTVTMTINTLPVVLDTTPPTISISSNDSALTVGETATISFALSETSSNFSLTDVTAFGGTLSNFSGSGTSYTALFTPTPNSTTNGVVSVSSTQFTDAAGNNNSASNLVTMTVNTAPVNTNNAPIAKKATLAAKTVAEGSAFSYTLDSKQFSDANKDVLTISATLQDNSTLPSWLTFNPTTKKLTGTPSYAAADSPSITIKFTADDGRGGTTSSTMLLNISNKATIKGTAKADTIVAGAGNDTINGGLGNDTLTGGLGNDTFVFNTKLGATNIDTITDFTSGDKIALAGSIFSKLKGDKDLSDNFALDSATTDKQFLIYNTANGTLYYDADGSGIKAQIEVAIIGLNSLVDLNANNIFTISFYSN